jgi:hypothetical protein
MNAKSKLLFLVSDDRCAERTTATATLAWLAAQAGSEFDAYLEQEAQYRPAGGPISVPFTGNWHAEQFYFIANFFDITFCSMSTAPEVQYRREALAMGANVLTVRGPEEIAECYLDVFGSLGQPLPGKMVVLPAGPDLASGLEVEPFCYPDVYYSQALGVSAAAPDDQLRKLREAGVSVASVLYCDQGTRDRLAALGFQLEVVDELKPGDTYGAVTSRIADRWIDRAKGVGFGNQNVALKMMALSLRHDFVTLYEPVDWIAFAPKVGAYAEKVGNKLIWGQQTVDPGPSDHVITEFSKYDCAMSLWPTVVGPTIQEKILLPLDWLEKARAPWQEEYSDDFLEEKVRAGAIPVCYLMYAADLGHLTTFPRLFDLMAAWYGRCGIGFPSTWYDFSAETLQQMYIPERLGGVFPRVEPLVSSTGTGVGTEAKGFISKQTQLAMIGEALESIRRHVGVDKVPIGYLPWEDACPYYKHDEGEPMFDIPQELGFEYVVTYKAEGKQPQIVFEDGRFIVVNKQNVHWRGEGGVLGHTKLWEDKLAKADKSGWIIIDLDAPFWFQLPHYFDPVLPTHYNFEASLVELATCMRYVDGGGDSGKLFIAKPHEVVRFARILKRVGKL